MTERPSIPARADPFPGLCGGCRFSRKIESRRGSVFRLCERSETDPTYLRYPQLPVLTCSGYEPAAERR